MARRRDSIKREILPDPRYNSKLVAQFVNVMMRSGKKSISQRILYDSFDIIEQKSSEDGLVVFRQAINNAKPLLEIRSRRVGGATYQVPVDVRPERRTTLSIRWLIQAARSRNDKTMAERVAGEIIDAFNNQGGAMRRKDEQARMAEANRAFAHFRW
ncbi:30S ribosomal protein S7 [Candidatus Poribacteria bacterium]|jgi:small subunit ribosomal protein S7|nr:30S ribosomal protein S7 [Candidatus Poribacteria bacterium]|tara:strand:- start:138 stop:608 length:471 start_codon:yes stop_codon:yes gene_type:complete